MLTFAGNLGRPPVAITTFLAVRIVCERGELTGGRVAAFCSHPSENKEMSNKKKGEVSEVFSVNATMEMEQSRTEPAAQKHCPREQPTICQFWEKD